MHQRRLEGFSQRRCTHGMKYTIIKFYFFKVQPISPSLLKIEKQNFSFTSRSPRLCEQVLVWKHEILKLKKASH